MWLDSCHFWAQIQCWYEDTQLKKLKEHCENTSELKEVKKRHAGQQDIYTDIKG